jgi:hypothetical protein
VLGLGRTTCGRTGIAQMVWHNTSRYDPQQICRAIFERSDLTFRAAPTTEFATVLPTISGILRRYWQSSDAAMAEIATPSPWGPAALRKAGCSTRLAPPQRRGREQP